MQRSEFDTMTAIDRCMTWVMKNMVQWEGRSSVPSWDMRGDGVHLKRVGSAHSIIVIGAQGA